MYNRSLVLALFGLVYVDHPASQHLLLLAYLVLWTYFVCHSGWWVNFCFCYFFEVWTIYQGNTHNGWCCFLRRRIALSLSPSNLSPELHFGFTTRRKARRILSLSFFCFLLRTGGMLFNCWKWMILEFKIVGLVTFLNFAFLSTSGYLIIYC